MLVNPGVDVYKKKQINKKCSEKRKTTHHTKNLLKGY